MSRRFDAIVIGAGQAGPPLVGRLAASGMTVAIVERKLIGGTCVNTGCTPTKTLIASARVARSVRRAADYGVASAGPIEVDLPRVKARADAVVLASRNGLENTLRKTDRCTVLHGHARSNRPPRFASATSYSFPSGSSSIPAHAPSSPRCPASKTFLS